MVSFLTGQGTLYIILVNGVIPCRLRFRTGATMDAEKLEFFRKLLTERLNHLLEEAGATLGDLTTEKEDLADALDIATMESNRDFQLRIRDRERVLIRKIRMAIEKISTEEYGYCATCGNDITEKRLIARPVALNCIDCKTEAEQLERRSRSF